MSKYTEEIIFGILGIGLVYALAWCFAHIRISFV